MGNNVLYWNNIEIAYSDSDKQWRWRIGAGQWSFPFPCFQWLLADIEIYLEENFS